MYNFSKYYISFILTISLAAGFFCLSSCNNNQVDTKEAAISITPADKQFFDNAARENLFVIRLAEEAIIRCSLNETRELAETIVKKHSIIVNDLAAFAGKRDINPPLDLTSAELKKWQVLVREKGVDFDKKFLELLQLHHQKSLKVFNTIAADATDPELKKIGSALATTTSANNNLAIEAGISINARKSRDTLITNVADTQQL